ncbi:hypothetical protein ZPAH1_orf00375 [Aeromonas phage ZPAH1]|nr:hypothetical protein ASwh1_330 [Aeromonas phage Aswh_1]QQG34137.1 hypothetical protein ZPAH1_orf00375 [Aeromonas phage ZPAH1]
MRKSEFPFNMFPFFFGFVFLMIIATIGVQGYIAYVAYTEVKQNGVKGVAEQIWCGNEQSEECKESLRKTIQDGISK